MIEKFDGLCHIEGLGLTTIEDRMAPDTEETAQLMAAWLEERGRSIECLLLLGRVRRLLSRVTAEARLSEKSGREAMSILRAIKVVVREGLPTGV